jgi:hypothetical protein
LLIGLFIRQGRNGSRRLQPYASFTLSPNFELTLERALRKLFLRGRDEWLGRDQNMFVVLRFN